MNIIISTGDCNGIGMEVMAKAIINFDHSFDFSDRCDISIAGNTDTMQEYFRAFDYPVEFFSDSMRVGNRICNILECQSYSPVEFGQETESAGRLAAEAVETAVKSTIDGEFDALVTMPVSKNSLYKAGWKYPGHTEMLADRCGSQNPLMILFSQGIRVALATIHIPILKVPGSLSEELIVRRINDLNDSLNRDFGNDSPRIAVLGLNPHAGESGAIGSEETEIIMPAINKCINSSINTNGPFPADGFFAHGEYRNYDGILAMYHDQGLIPLKLLANGGGVNFTAGLPIVRTSPDHGTAFPIAGKGIASPASSVDALEYAFRIADFRKRS